MSFILDALRKSETERQQQQSAEFASVPTGRAPNTGRRWIWVVGVLLAINVAVLAGLYMRKDTTTSPPGGRTSSIDTSLSAPTTSAPSQPSFADKVATAKNNSPPLSTMPDAADIEIKVERQPTTAVVLQQPPDDTSLRAVYPTIHTVRANGAVTLPDLHLDIHVYSDVPKDRFVFINMSKLREGSQLDEGPVVHEITTDGVVLGHQGLFFLLPRD